MIPPAGQAVVVLVPHAGVKDPFADVIDVLAQEHGGVVLGRGRRATTYDVMTERLWKVI